MKKFILSSLILASLTLSMASCDDETNAGGVSCFNGIKDGDESGVDCGGSCVPCATCDDGIKNGDETGIDCGGSSCEPCTGIITIS